MAETLDSALSDLRTAIEALTPTTEPTIPFCVVEDYPAQGADDVPASVMQRAVLVEVTSAHPLNHIAGARTIWEIDVTVTLIRQRGRAKALTETSRRAADALQLAEMFRNDRPGEASGIRGWNSVQVQDPVERKDATETPITARATAGFTAVT